MNKWLKFGLIGVLLSFILSLIWWFIEAVVFNTGGRTNFFDKLEFTFDKVYPVFFIILLSVWLIMFFINLIVAYKDSWRIWLKVVVKLLFSIILFFIGFYLSAGLMCIGSRIRLLCGPWYLNSIVYFLMWPILLSTILLADLFGKSILALFVMLFFVIANILWIYLVIHTISWIFGKVFRKN